MAGAVAYTGGLQEQGTQLTRQGPHKPGIMGPKKQQLFKGVGVEVNLVEDDCAWANVEVPGLGNHTTNALRRAGWKGQGAVATVIVTTEGGEIKGASWALRGDLGKIRIPMRRLTPDLEITLDLRDLSGVSFPTITNPTMGGANHSEWMEGLSLVDSVKSAGVVITSKSEIAELPFMKDTGFSLRCVFMIK